MSCWQNIFHRHGERAINNAKTKNVITIAMIMASQRLPYSDIVTKEKYEQVVQNMMPPKTNSNKNKVIAPNSHTKENKKEKKKKRRERLRWGTVCIRLSFIILL